jgi:hypothetical protein
MYVCNVEPRVPTDDTDAESLRPHALLACSKEFNPVNLACSKEFTPVVHLLNNGLMQNLVKRRSKMPEKRDRESERASERASERERERACRESTTMVMHACIEKADFFRSALSSTSRVTRHRVSQAHARG